MTNKCLHRKWVDAPLRCADCGTLSMLVNGYGSGPDYAMPAVAPDPRQAALVAVRNMAFDWYCPRDASRMRRDCPECVAAVALDAYEAASRLDHGITS